jgi:hypothetical protein
MNDLLASLALAKEHLTKARKHADGAQTDSCLHDLIRAVANLESVLRELEARMRAYSPIGHIHGQGGESA